MANFDPNQQPFPEWVIEGQHWPHHLSNQPYAGSVNTTANETSVNHTATFESFILLPGEKKVEEVIDTRNPNTSIFKFNKEDHTLGNLLREKLLKNSHVMFSAYRVPHPLFPTFELRVQTDGAITPKEAVLATCRELVTDLDRLDQNFKREYALRKLVKEDENNQK